MKSLVSFFLRLFDKPAFPHNKNIKVLGPHEAKGIVQQNSHLVICCMCYKDNIIRSSLISMHYIALHVCVSAVAKTIIQKEIFVGTILQRC